ncbi:MAG: Arm DNA-binding domain-containing protein [Burkholderiales bacterium]|nr:Arm DNA-binding domain-containing protein [Burkholderiales bacterium]
MPLTDTAIRSAKPQAKAVKLFDGGGLYLEVNPAGGKWWRWKYRFGGKEKRLSLGIYPDVSLKAARDRRDAARKLVADGIDPSENRKAQKSVRADRAANRYRNSMAIRMSVAGENSRFVRPVAVRARRKPTGSTASTTRCTRTMAIRRRG